MGTGIAIVANKVAGVQVNLVDQSEVMLSKSKVFTGKLSVTIRDMA